MGLQSKLFRGDPKLEACLVSHSAHVTQGAVGDHVSKIQTALVQLDSLGVDSGELSAKRYGPSTAGAVLTFKKKRNIINRSYQTQADNIVGKMTIAALDREMLQREADPPIGERAAHCKFTDGASYQSRGVSLSFAVSLSQGPAISNPPPQPLPAGSKDPLDHAKEVLSVAQNWAHDAVRWLRTLRGLYSYYGGNPWSADALALFEAVNVHFHLRRLPTVGDHVPFLDKVIDNYRNILVILYDPKMIGDDPRLYSDPSDPRFGAYATADIGGFYKNHVKEKVWIHGLFLKAKGPKVRAAMILHECGHSAATALHYAYGHPRATGGVPGEPHKGVKHGRNYAGLTPDEALHNADTYATFAAHASTRNPRPAGDIRPGAHDLNT
jgi:hypothetical protein